jgi:hypothetical protein
MKKPRGPKKKKSPKHLALQAEQGEQPKQMPQAGSQSPIGPLRTRWRRAALWFWPRLQKWGRRVALLASVMTLILLMVPKITIQASVNASPNEAFGTQFAVTNQGNVPVIDVRFSCRVDASGQATLSNVVITRTAASVLWPGRTTTQNCGIGAIIDLNARVHVSVNYRWPIYFIKSTSQSYFRGLKGSAGYFLVPDVEP